MSKPKIFVDGQEGTTGLKIHEYLVERDDLEVLTIDANKRKDKETRRGLINEADIVYLCLPDSAAVESVSLIHKGSNTRVIDASTAHRTNKDWTYGLPELSKMHRSQIQQSEKVCVPGCHATGFITQIYPLVQEDILPKDYPVSCTSHTGYSGGGKALISRYEDTKCIDGINSPKPYGLKLQHKHLPEMEMMTGLDYPPIFSPIVGNFYQGMAVSIPLATRLLNKRVTAEDIHQVLSEYYADERFIRVMEFNQDEYLDKNGFFNPEACNGTNRLELFIFGNSEQVLLVARFDNLGKGASGAAIQNMNIMLGLDEGIGLKG